jgi:predicted O-linked N-acetylglucosamine transferase (SPINDLY family)
LEQIIGEIPNAKYVLIEGQNKPQTERLMSRWAKNSPLLLANSIFLPRMSQDTYLSLLDTVDFLLDPFYFGSGNTFYESMAVGTPLVTLPGDYMRSKIVAGGYKQMRLDDAPVAANPEEYIDWCRRLASDRDLRKSLKIRIKRAAQQYLFDDKEIGDEILDFFNAAVACSRETGGLLPVDWTPTSNGMESNEQSLSR